MLRLLLMSALVVCCGKTPAIAQSKPAQAKAAPNPDDLRKLENDWAQAVRTNDARKLSEILDDGWVGVTWTGAASNKANALAVLKTPGISMDEFDRGPMAVRFFDNTAVVTGTDIEKSSSGGNVRSKYVWTDVFVLRDGKWRAVASHSTKVAK